MLGEFGRIIFFLFFLFRISICFGALELTFIDVGDGDSILLKEHGGPSILLDTGNLMASKKIFLVLKEKGIDRLGALVLSHSDFDHIGGLFALSEDLYVGRYIDNGFPLPKKKRLGQIFRWYQEIVRQHDGYVSVHRGQSFKEGGMLFEVLWPPEKYSYYGPNPNSIVMMCTYKSLKILLMGDLVDHALEEFLQRGDDLRCHILKVSHHGSKHGTSLNFIEKCNPSLSVICLGAERGDRFLVRETVELLKEQGSQVFRTDIEGDISIQYDTPYKYVYLVSERGRAMDMDIGQIEERIK